MNYKLAISWVTSLLDPFHLYSVNVQRIAQKEVSWRDDVIRAKSCMNTQMLFNCVNEQQFAHKYFSLDFL